MPESEPADKKSFKDKVIEFTAQLTRTKNVGGDVMDTNLRRCLTTFDVTLLSLGHMVGSGVYVLTPTVARSDAGPAIVISYLISGIASFLAALCYAELGVRYPRAGSAYSYTYLALGELWAFLVGWNVALENVIGIAAIARACSEYIDSLAGKAIQNGTNNLVGVINSPVINQLDFLSLVIVVFFLIFLSFGVQMTAGLNNVFSMINMTAIVLVIGVGSYYADTKNWTDEKTGGFMPYGWDGVFRGAAACFYAYVGFDSIAASGEEAKDPTKAIPLATVVSMGVAALFYILVGAVLTLMVSYKDISESSGLPEALEAHGANWAKIVVIIGAICGMSTGIIGSLFALTRVIYVMADDGLLFPICARVHQRTQIPLQSMYIFGAFAGIMAFCFEVKVLAQLMSIGTLFAYLVVSSSVIVIRYRPVVSSPKVAESILSSVGLQSGQSSHHQPHAASKTDSTMPHISEENKAEKETTEDKSTKKTDSENESVDVEASEEPFAAVKDPAGRMYDRFYPIQEKLNWKPGRLILFSVFLFVVFTFITCLIVRTCKGQIMSGQWWAVILILLAVIGVLAFFALILMHQQSNHKLNYKVPCVPLIPALSIMVNAWLIANFELATFVRLVIWILIGLMIYFTYGIRHSRVQARYRSAQSQLLSNGASSLHNWGSFEQDGATAIALEDIKIPDKSKLRVAASISKEHLIDSEEKSS